MNGKEHKPGPVTSGLRRLLQHLLAITFPILLLFSLESAAQVERATITGTVTDKNGQVLAGCLCAGCCGRHQ